MLTNNIVCGAMRGFGTPQAIFAMESAMNELARQLGMSPTELRRRNFLHEGDATATSHVLRGHAVSIADVMERAAGALGFDEKFARYNCSQEGPLRRGVGVACSIRGVSFGADTEDTGRARIVPQADGTVEFMCPMMEMGQGTETVLSQICADALGLPLERVHRLQPETDHSPDTGAAGASRGTFIGGNAILLAAAALKGQIAACLGAETVTFSRGQVLAGNRELSWEALYQEFRAQGRMLDAVACYTVPQMTWDDERCQGDAFILLYFQPVGSAEKYPQIMHFGILAIAGDDILSQTEVPFSYPCGTVRSMQRGASPLCVFIVEPDAGLSADFEAGYDV